MEQLDFLFVYEHKVRELENLCLAKYELDKRGYKTKIAYIEDAVNALCSRPVYHAKVLCTMACYNNKTAKWHAKDYVKFDKIIDLQWENIVYPKDEEREGAFKNYIEIGKDVVHVSWGEQNVKRLKNAAHIDPKKIKLTGHMGMDFLREPLNRFYTGREEFFKKYDLDPDKKTIFFASPYYGDALSEDYIKDMCFRFGDNWTDYYKFMCDSQHIVIEWFEKICNKYPDIQVVFRPHPGHPSIMADEAAKRTPNFRLIGEDSVKQWIVTCDRVYTGNSSVVVEAFFAKKMCELIFPIPVTEGFELKLISGARQITTYDEFEASITADNSEFPVPRENIEEIYLIDWDRFNFEKFADMAEEVLKDDYYKLTKAQIRGIYNYSLSTRMIKAISGIAPVRKLYLKMLDNEKNDSAFWQNQRRIRQRAYDIEKEYSFETTSDEEIESIIGRIRTALEG